MGKVKKAIKVFKNYGLKDGSKIIINKLKNKGLKNELKSIVQKNDLFDFYDYICFEEKKEIFKAKISKKDTTILWFIPDFGVGSGGHLNIFRMILNLSKLGIKSDIAICGKSQWGTPAYSKKMIHKHFFKIDCEIKFVKNQSDISNLNPYDVAMATSWQTAYYVRAFEKCFKKTYFIQDFEPFFYPPGSNYSFAENTYNFGFLGISAGSWISKKVQKDYGMQCKYFSFSYDKELYQKNKKQDNKLKKIFFYARPPTDRRGFELGLIVLKKLTQINKNIKVIFAGWDVSDYKIDFLHENKGIVAIKELCNLYSQCDVALVLSYTNLSLLPLELLASGCPVVINEGYNNSWIDENKKLFFYAKNDINSIVDKLNNVLNNKLILDNSYIDSFLQNSSWEDEAERVKNTIITYLGKA